MQIPQPGPRPSESDGLGWGRESAFLVNFLLVTQSPRSENQWSRTLKLGRFGSKSWLCHFLAVWLFKTLTKASKIGIIILPKIGR